MTTEFQNALRLEMLIDKKNSYKVLFDYKIIHTTTTRDFAYLEK